MVRYLVKCVHLKAHIRVRVRLAILTITDYHE